MISMLFYTMVLVGSLVAVLLVRYLYKAAALINKGISDFSRRFTGAGRFTGRHKAGIIHAGVMVVTAPSGQTSKATAWSLAQMHPVLPAANEKRASTWPHHVERSASAGKVSKVSRDVSKKVVKLEHVSKPFRRNSVSGTANPGTAHKTVTRRVSSRPLKNSTGGKPWGW